MGLLNATEALKAELESNARRGALVADFLDKYQLGQAEVAVLREGDAGGEAFQAALARVGLIHENCRQLLRACLAPALRAPLVSLTLCATQAATTSGRGWS